MSDVNPAAAGSLFLPLFTGVRGETVWKIGMAGELGDQKADKMGRKALIGRCLPPKRHGRRGLQLFSKQFRKGYSANFVLTEF